MLISDFFQLVVENVCALNLIMWPRFNWRKSENNRLPDHCNSIDYGKGNQTMKFDQVKEHKKNIFFFKIHAFPYICLLQVFPAGRLIRSYSRVDAIVFKLLWIQNQPPRGVHRNRCSENMQQIYRRILMPKCDFNKVAKHMFTAYFQNTFS